MVKQSVPRRKAWVPLLSCLILGKPFYVRYALAAALVAAGLVTVNR